jgi:hypothetical protein
MDAFGNLNTAKLEKELLANLQADIKYKQTDNMKKKAVKTAGSYEQFRAMVDCAHLKTLKTKEIESLKDVRKGWKKENTSSKANEALILEQEINDASKLSAVSLSSSAATGEFVKPKTPLELERDWRRLDSMEEKSRYAWLLSD